MQQGYYNATRAAQAIGISYKTMLRRIEEGKIIATKGEDNQFIIPESEVEKHKRKRLHYVHSSPVTSTPTTPDQSVLLSRIATLENRVSELEQTIRALTTPDHSIPVVTSKQKSRSVTTTPDQLPSGTLHSIEFAEQLGITRSKFDSMMKNGVGGEPLERTKIPIVSRPGKFTNWFSPDEQEKARELLKKHGKI